MSHSPQPDHLPNDAPASIQIGNALNSWEGLYTDNEPPLTPYLHLQAPAVDKSNPVPDQSKYPNVVGTRRLAVTDSARNIRKRSWMGWFLWGDGAPPPGITPGYPATEASPPLYNDDNWDFFSWQYSAGYDIWDYENNNGQWKAVRLDQQPLYLNPFRVNCNWPAGKFGYQKQPLQAFPNNVGFWKDKKIVRGPNLSLSYPYMVEYADYVDKTQQPNFPDEWRNSWLYVHTRPLETLVMVPGIKTPAELMTAGSWNQVGSGNEIFPYPVWDETLSPADQTPFCIKVDRMGDWDADLIWEGTHATAQNYDQNKYQPTAFAEAGKGSYLKMTVAQGSPLIWCETNNSQYVNFYNLIRSNEPGHIDNSGGTRPTNAGMAIDPATNQGVWDVPGVSDVQYVLLYGNQTNPNQFYHEVEPFKWDEQTGLPGGWNPPGKQSNHTYIAIYFKKDTVVPVDLTQHSGIDSDGNPYFYLQFNNKAQKNWYVVGAIPVMRYYHSGVPEDPEQVRYNEVPEDSEQVRLAAARQWAEAMGAYAFNFLTDTKISYQVANMYKATTTYQMTVANPYVAAGQTEAAAMTADAKTTIIALMPHHYQPITLGPDPTLPVDPNQPDANQIVWNPLQTVGAELPVSVNLPNANRSDPNSKSCWGYWSPRGNLKTLATDQFVTEFLFQNFLPLTPPPNWDKEYVQSSIQGVRVVNVGEGYQKLPTDVDVPPDEVLPQATIVSPDGGSGAQLKVILEPYSDRIQQIDVVSGGSGYPDGNPPQNVTVHIDAPNSKIPGGRTAQARAQVGGGIVLAVFMNDHGAGYRSTIKITTNSSEETDPAIVLPRFANENSLLKGLANVVVGGAGWLTADASATVDGTGTNATADVIKPSQILQIADIGNGFTDHGAYPYTGDPVAAAKSITVHVPPPAPGQPAQTMRVAEIQPQTAYFKTLITKPGAGYVSSHVECVKTSDSSPIGMANIGVGDKGMIIYADPDATVAALLTAPLEITFKATADAHTQPTQEATATIYPVFSVTAVELTGDTISGYQEDVQIAFSGGDMLPPGTLPSSIEMPEFEFEINPRDGSIINVKLKQAGSGFYQSGWFNLDGGKGFDAAFRPVLSEGTGGELLAVKVLRPGSCYAHYPHSPEVLAYTDPDNKPLKVTVEAGRVVSVDLIPGQDYSGFATIPNIRLKTETQIKTKDGIQTIDNPAKGTIAKIHFIPREDGTIQIARNPDDTPYIEPGAGYITTSRIATVDSLPIVISYGDLGQIVSPNQAGGFIATVAKPTVKVEQVLYDSLISRFSILASNDLRPFGGGFGGKSGPDGYGLGNALSSVSKILGVLYHLQQHYADKNLDLPSVQASLFAMMQTDNTDSKFEFPIYIRNNPLLSLKGGLKTMTQGLQRTLSLFFQQEPYTNNPTTDKWQMAYFSQYDPAGRVVVNPTSTIPVYGVVSSTLNPPTISNSDNQDKTGLNRWNPGMLWSGFGVSDQWNDQHYFYGYYLSTAAQLALLDGTWSDSKPDKLWADPDQMGTAIDQWMKTLAYDPALDDQYYDFNSACQTNHITYSKYSFFDQWNGHPWATGVSPGRAGDIEDGRRRGPTPWSEWSSTGTGNFPFDDENENSTWEGLQAYSAILMWGAGTNRKEIVDQGIYLLTTGNAASDLYFLDKNYNLKRSDANQYTWCPVITGTPVSQRDGGNSYPEHTGFVDSAPEAFYGEASAGCSILRKGSPSLNNFFYAFPTGSKFIQAYPPTPWTLGMTRNLSYMQKWAGAMMRPEWANAKNSALYQPGNWLGMAMTSALCGVPYNPGDDPTQAQPYVDRLWSSWNVAGQEPGSQATMQPAEQPTSVLTLLHVMEEYGAPDWSVYAKVTDQTGAEINTIVFTAAFTKIDPQDSTALLNTLVAFNPGWETRYVTFHRLQTDGLLANSRPLSITSAQPLAVPPKKMVLVTTLPADQPMSYVAALSDNTFVGIGEASLVAGQLFHRKTVDQDWILAARTSVAVSNFAVLPVEFAGQLRQYPQDGLLGVSNGDLYFRPDLDSGWIALPTSETKVDCVAVVCSTDPNFSAHNGIYGVTTDGKLVQRSQPEADWAPVTAFPATKQMQSLAALPLSATNTALFAGISRDQQEMGTVFTLAVNASDWQLLPGVTGFKSIANATSNRDVVVQPHAQTLPILTAIAKKNLQNQLTITATSTGPADPPPQILAVTNPQYYKHTTGSPDLPLNERTVIYHTGTQGLYLGQDQNNAYVEYVEPGKNLTVCAVDIYLLGSIKIPQGDVQLYCRTLTIPAGMAATIDVSGPAPDLTYQTAKTAEPQTSPPQADGTGVKGKNGSDMKGDDPWGDQGAQGGTITIYCDTIQLDSDLNLNAVGGQGYAGIDGQAGGDGATGADGRQEQKTGVGQHGQRFPHPAVTISNPQDGGRGGQGGDGLAGGCGGDGGTVTCTYRTCTYRTKVSDSSQIQLNTQPGSRGANGTGGAGGMKGLGGQLLLHHLSCDLNLDKCQELSQPTVVDGSQANDHPDKRTYYLSGNTPNPTDQGATGAQTDAQVTTKDDQGNIQLVDLGTAIHDMFLFMLFQSISFRYLNCTPEQFSGTVITYSGGNSQEWQAIQDLVNWLNLNLLSQFNKASDDQGADRKYRIWQKVNNLASRLFTNKTYYGDLPNWIPRAKLTDLFADAKDAVTTLKAVEADFLTLANKYEQNSDAALKKSEYETTLTQAKLFYEVGYLTIVGGTMQEDSSRSFPNQLAKLGEAVETANQDVDSYIGEGGKLEQATQELKDAVQKVFNFSFDNLIKGLEQLVFVYHPDNGGGDGGGGITPFKAMGAVQLGSLVYDGATTITDKTGQTIQKDYLIGQIKDLGDDLSKGFEVNFFNPDGSFRTDLDAETRYLGQLDQLEQKVQDISDKLNSDTVTDVLSVFTAYRDALVSRSNAILNYNAAIALAADYYAKYDDADQKLKALQASPSEIDPYDIEILQTYQQRYQEQVEKVLRYIYLARRKAAFWTLGDYQAQVTSSWSDITQLWTKTTPGAITADSFADQLDSLETGVKQHYQSAETVFMPFPDEKTGEIRLSELHIQMSDSDPSPKPLGYISTSALIAALKTPKTDDSRQTYYEVSFYALPENLKHAQIANITNPAIVSNSNESWDTRISHIRPHLVGAATDSGSVVIEIFNQGNCGIDSNSSRSSLTPNLYTFQQDVMYTSFKHGTDFTPPQRPQDGQYEDFSDVHQGMVSDVAETVGINEAGLDVLGVFGQWTLRIYASNQPGDVNYKLDLSKVTGLYIYFKGWARSKKFQ